MESKAEGWARERSQGVSTSVIAQREGVNHTWVSRLTKPHGPFPRPGTPTLVEAERWVQDRTVGKSATQIARESGVPIGRVRSVTDPHGPFTRRLSIDGYLTLSQVAERLRVPTPTICHWANVGFMIASERRGSRRLWPVEAFEEWLTTADLQTCPECGAMTRDQGRHAGAVHK